VIEAIVGAVVGAGFLITVGALIGAHSELRRLSRQYADLIIEHAHLREKCDQMAMREKNFMQKPAIVSIQNDQLEFLGSLIAQAVKKHIEALMPKFGPN
jgi:hypothetical protein